MSALAIYRQLGSIRLTVTLRKSCFRSHPISVATMKVGGCCFRPPALSHGMDVVTDLRLRDIKHANTDRLQAVEPLIFGMARVVAWHDSQVRARRQNSLQEEVVTVRSQIHHAAIRRINQSSVVQLHSCANVKQADAVGTKH
jgi:hypothetical protein